MRSLPFAALTLLTLSACSSVAPEPLSIAALNEAIEQDRMLMANAQLPLEGSLTLHEAMARAVAYNLDHRTRMMQVALANGQFELAKFDMLPSLAASAGYRLRSNENAASSESVITRTQSLEPSTSQDQELFSADLRASWNILDFGVSYLQAKQETDRFLIAQGTRRKVMLNLLQQVRVAYWRALAAQRLSGEVDAVMIRTQAALEDIDTGLKEGIFDRTLEALEIKRRLMTVVQQLEILRERMELAHIQLATLINERPTSRPLLVDPGALPELPPMPNDLEMLELLALYNSPDYGEQLYNLRIEQRESRKALLRLLPSLQFNAGLNYDSNSYLVNQAWADVGTSVTWNIMRLASLPATLRHVEARQDLAEAQRMAINMATITQVNLAVRRYGDAMERLERARERAELEAEIARYAQGAGTAQVRGVVDAIQSSADKLRSELESLQAYADAQESLGALFVSLGLDPVPADYPARPIDDLAAEIRSTFQPWEDGRFPSVPDPVVEPAPVVEANLVSSVAADAVPAPILR